VQIKRPAAGVGGTAFLGQAKEELGDAAVQIKENKVRGLVREAPDHRPQRPQEAVDELWRIAECLQQGRAGEGQERRRLDRRSRGGSPAAVDHRELAEDCRGSERDQQHLVAVSRRQVDLHEARHHHAECVTGIVLAEADVAARLGYPVATVRMWRWRGLLPDPAVVVSGSPVWSWPDVYRWAKSTGRTDRLPDP
jgi:hypothetical protein